MKLVLDVGNTRIKWRMAGLEGRVAHTQEGWEVQLVEAWRRLNAPHAVFAGSVASEQLNQRVAECAHKLWPRQAIVWLRSQASCCGVRIQYVEPQRFGVDRFAALVAARAEFADNALIVVDVGTAITVEVLDAAGLHRGGLIMPGLKLLGTSLMRGASQLSQKDESGNITSCAPQNETGLAVSAGALCMVRGGVVHAVGQALLGVTSVADIVLTGGDQALLESTAFEALKLKLHRRESLVLHGLERMAHEVDDR